MYVYNSGDVSLGGANFSECTSGDVCLPHARTRLPPPHTHARTPSPQPEAGEEGGGTWGGKRGTPSPKGRSGPARPLSLADALPA